MSESELIPLLPSAWLFWVLVAGTLTIGFLRFSYGQRFRKLIRQPFRNAQFDRGELRLDIFNGSLEIWSVIAIGLALTLITRPQITFSDWAITVRHILIIGVFLASQGFVYQLAGYLFQDQDAYGSAWHEKSVFLRWTAIWITPALWWLSFGSGSREIIAYIGSGFLILLYVWSLGRMAIVLLNSSSLRGYHNLLYLCALEISPVLFFLFLAQ